MNFDTKTKIKIKKLFQEIYEIDQAHRNGEKWNTTKRSKLFSQLDKIYGVV